MFQGDSVQVSALGDGIVEARFDRRGESINKLDGRTVDEFRRAVEAIAADAGVRGVLVSSGKDVFIVGADITEFGALFRCSAQEITADVEAKNRVFTAFEDLPVPSVVAINGHALGGGLELALAGSQRVMSASAQVGVPEVRLGLFPGFGGTLRLPRVAGPQVALDMVVSGTPLKADAALKAGVVDHVAAPQELRAAALALLRRCIDGEVDWRAAQQRKRAALPMPAAERASLFDAALAQARRRSGRHQPAAAEAVQLMAAAAGSERSEALRLEAEAFGRIAKTQAAASLVQAFLNEQTVKKLHKQQAGAGRPVARAAVLGAGIMGGGIALSSALSGMPVRLKDIAPAQLELGLQEAGRQLARRVQAGRMVQAKADAVLASITPQQDNAGFGEVDIVIEAIVEKIDVKRRVLAELETTLPPEALIASNTSSLRIDDIASALARPQNFVGMHFFNPVPVMPLVEVIRGRETTDAAVATAVALSLAMKKTPIVVKDGPGFLVNRLLTAYMLAFVKLVADGADFERIDQAMEAWGWPMGPAYLEDVIGMDTGSHVSDVICAGYPERMAPIERDVLRLMVQHQRYGQKNGRGFYRYEADSSGKPKRSSDPQARALVATIQPHGPVAFDDAQIVDRLMLPMLVEAVHALASGEVGTAAELDTAMLLGVGYPAYAGGPLKTIDWLGAAEVVARCERFAAQGPAYAPPPLLRQMAVQGRTFHPL